MILINLTINFFSRRLSAGMGGGAQ
jgi:hypothetical protein